MSKQQLQDTINSFIAVARQNAPETAEGIAANNELSRLYKEAQKAGYKYKPSAEGMELL